MSELRQPPQAPQQQPQQAGPPQVQMPPPLVHTPMQQPVNTKLQQALSAPIPGQSLTSEPGNAPWEHPPQFNTTEDAINYLADQMLEPDKLKDILFLFKNGISIEEVTRTVLFAGFGTGKWTMDTALLLYRPLMMFLIAVAHRAKLKDTPILMANNFNQNNMARVKMVANELTTELPQIAPNAPEMAKQGFMQRLQQQQPGQ